MGVEYFTVMTRYHVPVDFYDLAIQAFQCPVPARITFVPQQVTGSFQRCGRSPHRKSHGYEWPRGLKGERSVQGVRHPSDAIKICNGLWSSLGRSVSDRDLILAFWRLTS